MLSHAMSAASLILRMAMAQRKKTSKPSTKKRSQSRKRVCEKVTRDVSSRGLCAVCREGRALQRALRRERVRVSLRISQEQARKGTHDSP